MMVIYMKITTFFIAFILFVSCVRTEKTEETKTASALQETWSGSLLGFPVQLMREQKAQKETTSEASSQSQIPLPLHAMASASSFLPSPFGAVITGLLSLFSAGAGSFLMKRKKDRELGMFEGALSETAKYADDIEKVAHESIAPLEKLGAIERAKEKAIARQEQRGVRGLVQRVRKKGMLLS